MTHLLRETGERLWSLLGEQGAHLYVCGDAKMMAKDVRNIVREICQVKSGICKGCIVSRLPPPGFEMQISRLPGKGGYSTRPSGTTSSLVIWVES